MPIRSKSQLRRFGQLVKEGKLSQAEMDKWIKETPNIKGLPERLGQSRPGKIKKAKVI